VYPDNRPAKQKRATLQSDVSRDNRMGGDGYPSGEAFAPPHPAHDIQSYPHAWKTAGARGQSPRLLTDIIAEQLADIIAEQ
jgi:hypothetical protein